MRQEGAEPMRRLPFLFVALFLIACQSLSADPDPPHRTLWYEVDDQGEITVDLYFFWTATCPHCRRARPFIADLVQEHTWIRLHSFELGKNRKNADLYMNLARKVGGDASSVPGFIFCGHMLTGFGSAENSGKGLRESLLNCREAVRQNVLGAGSGASEGPGTATPASPSLVRGDIPSQPADPGRPGAGGLLPARVHPGDGGP